MYQGIVKMSEAVTAASGGRLVMKYHPAGAIAPAAEEFDAVHDGSLDYAMTAFTYWKDKFPAAGPFTFMVAGLSPIEKLAWYLTGGGKELADRMIVGYNVKLLPGVCATPEIFLSSSKPLETLDDIKGLKIRTAGDDGEIFSAMGAAVVFTPSGEVYEAMQRGVLDAFQLSSPAVDWTMATQEVADYIYLSGVRQPAEYHSFLFNTNSWAELPDDLKALVEQCCLAEAIRYYTWMMANDIEAVKKFKDYGTNIEPASKIIEDELVRQAEIFYDEKAAGDPFFAEVINSLREFQKIYREAWARL